MLLSEGGTTLGGPSLPILRLGFIAQPRGIGAYENTFQRVDQLIVGVTNCFAVAIQRKLSRNSLHKLPWAV